MENPRRSQTVERYTTPILSLFDKYLPRVVNNFIRNHTTYRDVETKLEQTQSKQQGYDEALGRAGTVIRYQASQIRQYEERDKKQSAALSLATSQADIARGRVQYLEQQLAEAQLTSAEQRAQKQIREGEYPHTMVAKIWARILGKWGRAAVKRAED